MTESPNDQPQLQGSPGYAILITNKHFQQIVLENPEDSIREGADVDDTNLQYIFNKKLKFQLLGNKTYKNVSLVNEKQSWIHDTEPTVKANCPCISCKIQTTDHSKSECFVLAISTHGIKVDGEQEIYFSDAFPTRLEDIIETLNDDNCPMLRGKPRIILLQVCRSDPGIPKDKQDAAWHDKGHSFNVVVPEGSDALTLEDMTISDKDDSKMDVEEEALRNLPSDFLVVFPTVSGKKAWHNFTDGSWLIDELRKVVENHDFKENPNMNFLSVLTSAAGGVARDKVSEKGDKNAVCIVHRLLRPIIFKDIEDIGLQDKPAL